MSTASKARKKAMKRAKDAADPERTAVRNAIRRGVAPKWCTPWRRKGIKKIISSFGMIIDVKAIERASK